MVSAEWLSQQVTIFAVMDALGVGDGGPEETRQRLCPVHHESRPSARVYAGTENRVFCFSCGRGWDVVGLVMAVQRVPYPVAAAWLMDTFALGKGASLPSQVRQTLMTTSTSAAPLFRMAEAALRAAKPQLTLDAFTRCAMALDVVQHQYQAHEIDRPTAQKHLTRVLQYLSRQRRVRA